MWLMPVLNLEQLSFIPLRSVQVGSFGSPCFSTCNPSLWCLNPVLKFISISAYCLQDWYHLLK